MPHITSAERIGMRKGMEQGIQQGFQQGILDEGRELLLEALEARFGQVPMALSERVQSISDRAFLKTMLRTAIRCKGLDAFEGALKS